MSDWAIVGGGEWSEVLGERLERQDHAVHLAEKVGLAEALAACERVILTAPPSALEAVVADLSAHLDGHHRVVTTARGLTPDAHLRASELVVERTAARQIAVLAGAADPDALRHGDSVALVVGSAFTRWSAEIQHALAGPDLRVYTNADAAGVELAHALAVVIGVAMGAARAMGVGAATEATALTRGVAEMERLVCELGGRSGTAYGLAGLGVLTTLVFEADGAAFALGQALVAGHERPAAAPEIAEVARTIAARAEARRLRAPMVTMVASMLAGKIAARDALARLMARSMRAEQG